MKKFLKAGDKVTILDCCLVPSIRGKMGTVVEDVSWDSKERFPSVSVLIDGGSYPNTFFQSSLRPHYTWKKL